jgi:hypothetical protein
VAKLSEGIEKYHIGSIKYALSFYNGKGMTDMTTISKQSQKTRLKFGFIWYRCNTWCSLQRLLFPQQIGMAATFTEIVKGLKFLLTRTRASSIPWVFSPV